MRLASLLLLVFLAACAAPVRAPTLPAARGLHLAAVRAPGAEGCPDGARLQREVASRVESNPFKGTPTCFVDVTFERDGAGWVARIYTRDPNGRALGERVIRDPSPSCGPIAEAVTTVLSILPHCGARAPQALKWPAAAPTVTASALAVGGILPGAALGASLRAEAAIVGPLRWTTEWVTLPPITRAVASGAVTSSFTGTSLGACGRWVPRPWLHLEGCAAGLLGVISLSVQNGVASDSSVPWGAAQVALRGRVVLVERTPYQAALELGVQTWIPFRSVDFRERASAAAHFEGWPATLVGSAGVSLSFR